MNKEAVFLTKPEDAKIVMDTWAKISNKRPWDDWEGNVRALTGQWPIIFILQDKVKEKGNIDWAVNYRNNSEIGDNFSNAKYYARRENLKLLTYNEFLNKYTPLSSKHIKQIDWNMDEGVKMKKSISKRLERMLAKEKKAESEDDLEIAKKQIKKHKKTLERLRKYDEQ